MKNYKSLVLFALCTTLFVGGCSFLTSKPDTKEQQITIAVVRVAAATGCDIMRREDQKAAQKALHVIDNVVTPLLNNNDPSGALNELTKLNQSLVYLAPMVQLALAYIEQEQIVDKDSTYMQLVTGVTQSCRASLVVPLGLSAPLK